MLRFGPLLKRLNPFNTLKSAHKLPLKTHQRSYATHASHWNRLQYLRRPILFTAGVLAFDHFVLPPILDSEVLKGLQSHPEYLVYGIMALNVGVFFMWRILPAQRVMDRYFLLHKDPDLFSAWSMIGAAFSHGKLWHLALNMVVLWQSGVPVARWLGASNFLQSYMDSCVLSMLGSFLIPQLIGPVIMLPSLGASGAIESIFGIFSYLAPNTILVPWLPIDAWSVFLFSAGYSVVQILCRASPKIDHAAHLAGALTGIGWGWLATERMRGDGDDAESRETLQKCIRVKSM